MGVQGCLRRFVSACKADNVSAVDGNILLDYVCSLPVLPSSARTYLRNLYSGLRAMGMSVDRSGLSVLDHLAFTGIYNPINLCPPLPNNIEQLILALPAGPVQAMLLFLLCTGRRAGDLLCIRSWELVGGVCVLNMVGTKSDRLGHPEWLEIGVPVKFVPGMSAFPFPVKEVDVCALRAQCRAFGVTPKSFRVHLIRKLESSGVSLSDIALVTGHHDLSVMASSYLRGRVSSISKKQRQMSGLV